MHLSYRSMVEKVTFLWGIKVFASVRNRILNELSLCFKLEWWNRRQYVLGDVGNPVYSSCYLIIAFYSPITAKLLNTVHWLILLLKTFKGDYFLRSSGKLGLKGAVMSHPHTHFCSLAYKGCLVQKGPQNTRSSHCLMWSTKSSQAMTKLSLKDQKL